MTDTRLILSAAKRLKKVVPIGERNSAGVVVGVLCFVLGCCHSYIVPSVTPFSLCPPIFHYLTLLAYIERQNVERAQP